VLLRERLEPDRQAGWAGSSPGASGAAAASGVSTGTGGASAGIVSGSGAVTGSAGSLEESEPPNKRFSQLMRRMLQGFGSPRL
jgi:hypothetical protein